MNNSEKENSQQKTSVNLPNVSNVSEDNQILNFTMENANVSIVNGLRRTIFADIETVVFKCNPHKESLITIEKNNTQLNNEVLKQRLECIPIHITDPKAPLERLEVHINETNDSGDMKYITTEHFKVYDINTKTYLSEKQKNVIFPPNEFTKDYILFARLRPRISKDIPYEEIKIIAKLMRSSAEKNGAYNITSTCAYGPSIDVAKQDEVWKKKEDAMTNAESTQEEISLEKKSWFVHEGLRITIPHSYDFIIETLGIYKNTYIVQQACNNIINRLNKIIKNIETGSFTINTSKSNIQNSYDVILYGEDYTIGKIIEYVLYENYFKIGDLTFVGFIKEHPHDNYSIIRVAFPKETNDNVELYKILQDSCKILIKIYEKISADIGL
jgi:DNA-directed RNA polymerase subunit L